MKSFPTPGWSIPAPPVGPRPGHRRGRRRRPEDAALFAAEAAAADSDVFEPVQHDGERFGLGKARALRLGADRAVLGRVLASVD